MSGETPITIIGNLTGDPELRYTTSGAAVASFTIASTPRRYNSQTSQWEDQEALFLRCSVWRDYAEHVTNSLKKGMRVIAQGNLRQRSWQTEDGSRRISVELDVQEIGPALRYAECEVRRISRDGNSSFSGGRQDNSQPFGGGVSDDPWGSAPSSGFEGENSAPF